MLQLQGQTYVLELLARGKPLNEVLDALIHSIHQTSGMNCSICLLDEDGKHLRYGSAPGMPEFYNKAFDGLAIGPRVGSCGTAAYTKKPVIVKDVLTDPLWEGYRELAIKAQFRACWSTPILSKEDTVLGTFAIYYNEVRVPNAREKELIRDATSLAAVVLDHARTQSKLQQANLQLEQAISIASHELNTPLTSLMMQVHLLEQLVKSAILPEQSKQAVFKCFSLAIQDLTRFANLVKDLLDSTRVNEGKLILKKEKIDLNALVFEIVDRYKLEIENYKSAIVLKLCPGISGPWDRNRLDQVIVNILRNALKFGRGQPLEVRTQLQGTNALVEIQDHGPGIHPNDQLRIFDRFEQVKGPGESGGLGLGLFIARQIVEAHGGSITVASEVGQGSTFKISLPT